MAEYYNSGDCIDGKRVLIRFKRIQMQPNTYVMSPTGFKGTPDVRVYAEIETPFESIAKSAEKKFLEMKQLMDLEGPKPQAAVLK